MNTEKAADYKHARNTPLLLELGMSQCVICGKDAEECEHHEPSFMPELYELADHETDAERNQ